jgi:hypothetical protein
MRIIAMTNEGQLPMMKNMLNSAMKCGFPMSLFHCYILDSQKEAATYNTQEFQTITKRKLEIILHNMNLDNEVLWIDNDIVLFENIIQDVRKYHGNFVMQDDLWGFCTGFFLARSSPSSKRLIQKSIENIQRTTNSEKNDQHAFNEEYSVHKKTSIGFHISKLPLDEYPNGQIYFNENRKSKAKMVHSNYLATTSEKVQRFKDFNLWDESDTGFNCVNTYFI